MNSEYFISPEPIARARPYAQVTKRRPDILAAPLKRANGLGGSGSYAFTWNGPPLAAVTMGIRLRDTEWLPRLLYLR